MNINEFIGKKIKEFRTKKNITQEELGEFLNTTSQTVSRYESGKLKTNQDILYKLAEYFKVSVNDFFPPIENGVYNLLGDKLYDEQKSITELSILTNIKVEDIQRIYSGEEKLPKPSILIKIARTLKSDPYIYLASSGYICDETYDDNQLYDTGIRYLLTENERQVLCNFLSDYWNKKDNNHKFTSTEIYDNIFSEDKESFSLQEVRNIMAHNNKFTHENVITQLLETITSHQKNILSSKSSDSEKDTIDISDLSDKDKEQIEYMIDLMRKNSQNKGDKDNEN